MPLKKAQKLVQRARKADQRVRDFVPQADFLRQSDDVVNPQQRQARLSGKVSSLAALDKWLDVRYANAERGLWGTRTGRKVFWGAVQNTLEAWKAFRSRQLSAVNEKVKAAENSYKKIHEATVARLKSKREHAVRAMNRQLEEVARVAPVIKTLLHQQLRLLETANARAPPANRLNAALFAGLRAKIDAEAANADWLVRGFRMAQLHKGIQRFEKLLTSGNRTDAETEINRLIAFNKEPPKL